MRERERNLEREVVVVWFRVNNEEDDEDDFLFDCDFWE